MSDGGSDPTIVSVYFEGTANPLDYRATQIGLFFAITSAIELNPDSKDELYHSSRGQYKIAFDGCGVTHGVSGLLFATGLWSQCLEVETHIKKLLSAGHKRLKVVAMGLSRGGIAVLYLAKLLRSYPMEQVEISLIVFDPVPGNLLVSAQYLDLFGTFSTANTSLDLTDCVNLKEVLAIYPYVPLPDLSFHAPSLPNYPPQTHVEEDASLGCHQSAIFCSGGPASRFTFSRISSWLAERGVKLDLTHDKEYRFIRGLLMSDEDCVEAMDIELSLLADRIGVQQDPTIRCAHSLPAGASIRSNAGGARYLNRHHKELAEKLNIPRQGEHSADRESKRPHEFLLEVVRSPAQPSNLFASCIPMSTNSSSAARYKV